MRTALAPADARPLVLVDLPSTVGRELAPVATVAQAQREIASARALGDETRASHGRMTHGLGGKYTRTVAQRYSRLVPGAYEMTGCWVAAMHIGAFGGMEFYDVRDAGRAIVMLPAVERPALAAAVVDVIRNSGRPMTDGAASALDALGQRYVMPTAPAESVAAGSPPTA